MWHEFARGWWSWSTLLWKKFRPVVPLKWYFQTFWKLSWISLILCSPLYHLIVFRSQALLEVKCSHGNLYTLVYFDTDIWCLNNAISIINMFLQFIRNKTNFFEMYIWKWKGSLLLSCGSLHCYYWSYLIVSACEIKIYFMIM